MSASLSQGQLMESITLEEALKLFLLPRTVGSDKSIDIIAGSQPTASKTRRFTKKK